MPHPLSRLSRRSLLRTLGLGGLGGLGAIACGRRAPGRDAATAPLAPTVAIPDDDDDAAAAVAPAMCVATADNLEGPFFKAGAPHRATLADASTPGMVMLIAGRVASADCRPLAGANLEVWHADATGNYDLEGWRLRGQLTTDRTGRWEVSSIVPGRYLNGARYRPRHVHFKLRAPGHRPLTTQLYFAGDPYNVGDPWFEPSLLIAADGPSRDTPGVWGRFDFVLEPA